MYLLTMLNNILLCVFKLTSVCNTESTFKTCVLVFYYIDSFVSNTYLLFLIVSDSSRLILFKTKVQGLHSNLENCNSHSSTLYYKQNLSQTVFWKSFILKCILLIKSVQENFQSSKFYKTFNFSLSTFNH